MEIKVNAKLDKSTHTALRLYCVKHSIQALSKGINKLLEENKKKEE